MKFNARLLEDGDYENILCDWWKDWKWDAPAKDFLPEEGRGGMMVSKDGVNICAGFMYFTNSKVAWCEWVVSNKQYRAKPNRKEAIELLIDSLTKMAKGMGKGFTYALIKHDGLIKTYESLGYTQGDSYNKEMIKVL